MNSLSEITQAQDDNNDQTVQKSLPLPDTKSDLTPTTGTGAGAGTAAAPTSAQKLLRFIKSDIADITDTSEKLKNYKTHVEDKIKNASNKLESFETAIKAEKLKNYKTHVEDKIKNASNKLESFETAIKEPEEVDPTQPNKDIEQDLRKLKKSVRKLKLPLAASRFKINYAALNKDPNLLSQGSTTGKPGDETNDVKEIMKTLHLYSDPVFEKSSIFQYLKARFQEIGDVKLKLCLLCFSIFPEGAIIKKRIMVYWWISEGFVTEEDGKSAEEVGCEHFKKLIKMGFINPLNERRWKMEEVGSCKVDPLIRFGLIKLADGAKMFDFDLKGNLKADFTSSCRACLLGDGLVNIPNLHKLHMLFNVNENILEFNQGWFSKMKNANIVYLGRWNASGKHHIEVDDDAFLEELEHMKHLKFLSFQGVSRVTELPKSISKMVNLIILDLRACHNLESVPREIGELKNLTHLDMWECYLLDYMPKQLSLLENLQVLKGFVVGDSKGKASCNLDDLVKLEKLIKLSILVKVKDFPKEVDLIALSQFKGLRKLTIAWGGGSTKPNQPPQQKQLTKTLKKANKLSGEGTNKVVAELRCNLVLPENLEKVDLQCYPEEFAPSWLKSEKLVNLKKLYIRGGKLRFLHIQHDEVDNKWKVKILCLKYLSDLEMDWKELCKLFPDVTYLEKVKCPKLTLFPCDQFGVWTKKEHNEN